ncbi:ATP-dependent DNA helicase PIF1 [Medicago truncatula]|uniref:ATP-dependent DNA helicase PIF1 n=1 Tax=Medicago truncatula TaxID=3880 RepID=UPI001967A36C|nr:ATP-dependent DNA helicase PIF1 [Medicago truncatula]
MKGYSVPVHKWRLLPYLFIKNGLYPQEASVSTLCQHIDDDDLKNLCLIEIEMLLQENGRSLTDFKSMPRPNVADMPSFTNKLIVDELNYNEDELEKTHADIVFFFLYGYGGTGKTFIWKTLSTAIRSKGLIVLNVASSGIETLLLPGGRTAHSKLAVPIEIKEASSLTMEKDSPRADLVCAAKLIIFYESPMMHQWCFEKVYRSMCDIMSKNDPLNKFRPFRGMIVVLGGDFRQILPVVREATRHDIVNALINSSKIWAYCNMLRLTVNMRLGASSLPAEQEEIANFGKWILSIRDGNDASDENGKMKVEIPEDFLISDTTNPLMSLIDVYPDLNDNLGDPLFFQERGILAPTLDSVEHVNEYMMSLIPGEEKEYLSSDSLCRSGENSDVQREWFTTEFLNGIKSYGIPNHRLKLRAGCPVMLMRNIDQTNGLSNGTRLTVTHIGKSTIAATIITGKREGTRVFIPRMNLIPSDPGLPFKFRRKQFPLTLCFAMTINKSQGQSLPRVGFIFLSPCSRMDNSMSLSLELLLEKV